MASNDELYNIFAATLSADKIQRQPAEDALQQLASTNPEFILQLMHFCSQYIAEDVLASNALHRSILLAAAIRFRNLISRCNWNRNTQQAWTEEVRSAVRQQLVPAQCAHHVGELIRRQLLSATTDLISYDYPSRWPEMVSQLHLIISDSMKTLEALDRVAPTADSTRSQAEALLRLKGALGVLRQCCKVYSEPQKVTEAEVEAFATSHAPSLISLMELLLTLWEREAKRTHDAESINGHPPTGGVLSFSPLFGELSHCIRLAIKCFVSLCHTRWPQYLCDGNVLQQFWAVCVQKPRHVMEQYIMPLCKARLEASMHEPGRATAERGDHFEDFQESPGWRVLKWSGALALKVTQEFISPKSCEKRARVAAQLFADNLMEPTAVSALELIRWHCADGQPLTSKAYIMAIEVLTILVSHKPTYLTVIHANAEELMTVLLFPRLSFSAEDEELWNSNPEEYVRRQSSPAGDLFNPKVVSSSLLLSLAVPSKKFHDGQLVFSLVNFLLNQLQAYSREAAAVTEEEPFSPRTIAARRVDAAMYCLCQFKAVMKLMNFGDDKIEYVLLTYAVPATQYPLGYLRCRAVLLISTYASGIQWSSPTTFQTVLQSVLPLLNDPDTCVQVQTCMSFSRLSTHPYAKEVIIPCIAQLIQQYFQVMRLMDNESVVRTLRKTITAYRDTLSQWALELTDMIVAHFTSVVSNVTGKYAALESTNPEAAADFMNCDAGEDDGLADALMAADELLDTITTLVHSLPPSTATATSSPAEIQQDMFVQLQMRVSPLLLLVLGQSNSSTSFGFMDPMLNLITTLLARSPAVAPPTWALVPCFHHLVTMRGSTDYIHELLAPLDNFCSVEPLHFTATAMSGLCELPAGAENFVSWTPAQIVLHFCESVWANDSLRQRELSAIPRLYESVLQNYWSVLRREVSGRSRPAGDPLTPQPIAATLITAVVQQAVGAMLHRPQSAATLHVLLANAVLSCLLADPASTVQCFQLEQHRSLGGVSLDDFLRRYAELCSTSAAGKASSHLRMYDRHLLVLSVGEAIRFLAVEQQQGRWNEGCDALHGALNHLVGSTYLLGEYANADAREAEERVKTIHKRISKTTAKKSKEAAAAAVADDDDDDEWASETDEETCSTVDLNALNDEEEEDWMGDDDDDDNLGDDGGKFQALLQQAQSMRKGGDGHSGHHHIDPQEGAANVEDEMETIEEDDEEEDLLAGDEFDSPIDNINVWDVLSNALSGGSSLPIAVLMTGDTSFQQQLAAMASASTLVAQLYSAEAQLMQVMRD